MHTNMHECMDVQINEWTGLLTSASVGEVKPGNSFQIEAGSVLTVHSAWATGDSAAL